VRFEVSKAVSVMLVLFWDVASCLFVCRCQRYGEILIAEDGGLFVRIVGIN
jgi:hypothetical protein